MRPRCGTHGRWMFGDRAILAIGGLARTRSGIVVTPDPLTTIDARNSYWQDRDCSRARGGGLAPGQRCQPSHAACGNRRPTTDVEFARKRRRELCIPAAPAPTRSSRWGATNPANLQLLDPGLRYLKPSAARQRAAHPAQFSREAREPAELRRHAVGEHKLVLRAVPETCRPLASLD